MALTPDEELELLELEEAEYQDSLKSGQGEAPTQPPTGLEKAVNISKGVTGAIDTALTPITYPLGKLVQGSEDLSNKLAESGHPGLGMVAAAPEIAAKSIAKPFEWAQKAGEMIAEKAPEWGVSPEISAGIGTGVAMIPDIAMGAEGIAKRALIAKSLGRAGEMAGKVISKPGTFVKELVTAPNAAEAAQLGKEKLVEVGERGAEKLAAAREAEAAAKKGLIGAEEEAGLHFTSTPEFESFIGNPKKLAGFSQKASRLAKQGAQSLSQTVDSQTLQTLRKIAQEGEKVTNLSDIAKAQMREAKDIFTQALGKSEPAIGEQLGRFREAGKVVKEIPGEIKEKLGAQKMRNAEDVLKAKKIERNRKLVKSALAATGAYLGARSIFK